MTDRAEGSAANEVPIEAEPDQRLAEFADRYIPKALDTLEGTVDTVKRLTTDRVIKILVYAVYGLLLFVLAVTALILLIILGVRLIDSYFPGPLWAWYLGLAGMFGVIGMLLFSRRNTPK